MSLQSALNSPSVSSGNIGLEIVGVLVNGVGSLSIPSDILTTLSSVYLSAGTWSLTTQFNVLYQVGTTIYSRQNFLYKDTFVDSNILNGSGFVPSPPVVSTNASYDQENYSTSFTLKEPATIIFSTIINYTGQPIQANNPTQPAYIIKAIKIA